MTRYLPAFLALCGCAALALADPIKKAPAVDADKLSKECAEGFLKAVMAGKGDEGMKFLAAPFRDHSGQRKESLDEFKKEFDRPPPAGAEIKISGEPIELSKLNDVLKKKEYKELDAATLEDYQVYLGKEGRIVLLELNGIGARPPGLNPPHMLIRVKDGKAHIVGVGER